MFLKIISECVDLYMVVNDILKDCFSNLDLPDLCSGIHIKLSLSIT